jgi:hypothetical protein
MPLPWAGICQRLSAFHPAAEPEFDYSSMLLLSPTEEDPAPHSFGCFFTTFGSFVFDVDEACPSGEPSPATFGL